jgi:hypothetical protein
MRSGRALVVLPLAFASLVMMVCGCGPDEKQRAAIESAIEYSDSLRRRPLPNYDRRQVTDAPIATTTDSDSVILLPLNVPRKPPEGPIRID